MNPRKHGATSKSTSDRQVIVLTHTEVGKDNRIVKTIKAMLSLDAIQVFAVGVKIPESTIPDSAQGLPNLQVHNLFAPRRGRLRRMISSAPLRNVFKVVGLLPFHILAALIFNVHILSAALRAADRHKVRLVYCNDEQSLLAASVLAAITRSKLVYDAHELEHDKNGQSKIVGKLTLLWEKFLWPSVDHFITVSESIRLHYLETLGPKPSTVVLNSPSASGSQNQTPWIGDVRSVLGLDLEDLILLYAGYFADGRGIRTLLDCAEKLPKNHHLVFLGEGELLPEIASYSEKFKQVHVINPVPYDKLVDFISTADIGLCLLEPVSASDTFALPNKFFDYAFAGLPILYSDFPEMSKVAHIYGLGEKCENSVDSIFRGVSRLKGTRTPPALLEPLSWEYQENVLIGILNSLLDLR